MGHRHVSHLFALYPAAQIDFTDKEMLAAAEKTLKHNKALLTSDKEQTVTIEGIGRIKLFAGENMISLKNNELSHHKMKKYQKVMR